jgi:hypothetical protein
MKKVVPTLLLTIAMLFGQAQAPSIWFNELVPDPGPNEDEYIEFYNTSLTDIELDCYIVVAYFKDKQGNDIRDGLYVYNFPDNATIKALSRYIISSNNPVRYKTSTKDEVYTPTDLTSYNNWNEQDAGGYISKYIYNNGSWGNAQSVPANFNNFIDIANGNDATLFLYKINSDGTTSYVNGFIANSHSSDITASLTYIQGLGSLPINANTSCAPNVTPITLSFAGLSTKTIDVVTLQQAAGSGQGYAKIGDGYCGSWEKIQQGEFTPGSKNTLSTEPSAFTSAEYYYCTNVVSFSVQSATQSFFPIIAELYQDNGTTSGTYDTDDDIIASTQINAAGSTYYTIPVPGTPQQLILVYRSTLGCFTKVVVLTPAATPTVSMTGEIFCMYNVNNRRTVTYSITSVSATDVFPLTLISMEDNGTPENTSDDRVIETHTVSSLPFEYTAELLNGSSNVNLSVQSSPLSCLTGSHFIPNNCTVLPVRLRSFTAGRNKQKKEQVLLKWETASEQNNRGFKVQRKTSGVWKDIAFVTTQADNGNSNITLAYEYTDVNTFSTATQYRLLQVDIDGKADFSDVRTVLGTEQNAGIVVYPNPGINGKVNVLFKEQNATKQVIVSDASGRLVKQFPQVRDNILTIEGLPKGFYTIKIIDRSTMSTSVEKVIIN